MSIRNLFDHEIIIRWLEREQFRLAFGSVGLFEFVAMDITHRKRARIITLNEHTSTSTRNIAVGVGKSSFFLG